jgi:hypothetical protein
MITFNITFDASPGALGGYLEYRYIQSDGTFSPWQVNLNLGNTLGYFPITTPTVTLTNVIGNVPDWQYNTVYQFRVRQLCGIDLLEQISNIDGDYFVPLCPSYTTAIGAFDPVSASYPIFMTIPSTVGLSISNYIFYIYNALNPSIPLTSEVVSSSVINSNLPYQWKWDDNNVPGGIVMNTSYLVSISYSIVTSTTSELIECEAQGIIPPSCNTYYIETGDNWGLEWTDCSGTPHFCFSKLPYNGVAGYTNCQNSFFLCSLTVPIGYTCNTGVITQGYTTRIDACSPIHVSNGALVKFNGIGCSGKDFQGVFIYDPAYGSLTVPCQACQ